MASARNLSDPIALRIPADVLAEIEQIAEISDRSRSWVIVRALKAYLSMEGAEILAVAEGRGQVERGDYRPLADVIDEMERAASKSAA